MSDERHLRELACMGVRHVGGDLEAAFRDVETELEQGRVPSKDQLIALREALWMAQHLTEDRLAAVVDGAEPWENPDFPYSVARSMLRGGRCGCNHEE